MRKFITFTLVLVMLLSLVSCSKEETIDAETTTTEETTEATTTICEETTEPTKTTETTETTETSTTEESNGVEVSCDEFVDVLQTMLDADPNDVFISNASGLYHAIYEYNYLPDSIYPTHVNSGFFETDESYSSELYSTYYEELTSIFNDANLSDDSEILISEGENYNHLYVRLNSIEDYAAYNGIKTDEAVYRAMIYGISDTESFSWVYSAYFTNSSVVVSECYAISDEQVETMIAFLTELGIPQE